MAAILIANRAGDLFGTPEGTPQTNRLIAASIQLGRMIMDCIDRVFSGWDSEKNG